MRKKREKKEEANLEGKDDDWKNRIEDGRKKIEKRKRREKKLHNLKEKR